MFRSSIFSHINNFCKEITKNMDNNLSLFPQPQSFIRLSKWMSVKSICSRREAEQIINLGLVRIDGKRIFENMMVPFNADMKAFTPIGLHTQKPTTRLWMMNKPRGYICSHSDPQKRPTIYSILPPELKNDGHIMSVGRLDFNSEGLLLLTNDTVLKNLLENPSANLERFYRVKVHGRVTPQKVEKMNHPIQIKGVIYGPLNVTLDRALSTNVWLNVGMKTGKNREIRRIMQKCDLQVNKLIRQNYGPYKLNSLKHGQLKEVPISPGLSRKIKVVKAEKLSSLPKCLIEVDIRQKAMEIAQQEKLKISHQLSIQRSKGTKIGTMDTEEKNSQKQNLKY